MIFWEMFMYYQNTLKILSLQYVVMLAVPSSIIKLFDLAQLEIPDINNLLSCHSMPCWFKGYDNQVESLN